MLNLLKKKEHLFGIYRSLFENNPGISYAIDSDGNFVLMNESIVDLCGFASEELIGKPFVNILRGDYIESTIDYFTEIMNGQRETFEVVIKTKTGDSVDLFVTAVPIIIENNILGVAGIAEDITEKNSIKKELIVSRNQLENIFNSIDICIWSSTSDGKKLTSISPACEEIFGYSQNDFHSNPFLWWEIVHPHDLNMLEEKVETSLISGRFSNEFRILNRKGDVKWIFVNAIFIHDENGEVSGIDGVTMDISQRRDAEEQLHKLAYYDVLTNLPNRRLFQLELEKTIKEGKDNNTKVALFYLDLDYFKLINDTLGHSAGDTLLRIVAKRLKSCLRHTDLISRQGGDEFAIIIKNFEDLNQLKKIADKLVEVIINPIKLNDNEYVVTTSIGISIYPEHSTHVEELIKAADQAMYLAKESGKNAYCFYNIDMSNRLSRKVKLSQDLRNALNNGELTLYYQPIINRKSNTIVGFEALLRWYHPSLGHISPVEFIPIAEESRLIIPIGYWVMSTACQYTKKLQDMGIFKYVSVNVSTKQIEEDTFINKVITILKETQLAPEYLKVELTESDVMTNVEQVAKKLQLLSDLGVQVFLDDFGTGYSSLSYLNKLPIHTLKIDKSFVQDINSNPDQETIIETIVAMAKKMHMDLIAEGVERINQDNYLKMIDCFNMQGFLFSKPIPFDDLVSHLINETKSKITNKLLL